MGRDNSRKGAKHGSRQVAGEADILSEDERFKKDFSRWSK